MRMPVLRYFIVVGSALFGLLLLVNNKTESDNSPVRTSQTVGLPQSVKMQPEPAPVLTAVNSRPSMSPHRRSRLKVQNRRRQSKRNARKRPPANIGQQASVR